MKNFFIKLFKNKLFVSFAVNALIMFFCIYVSSFSYDSYDDYVNSLLISHYHIPYINSINYLLAFAVSNIQYFFSTINLYVFAQVIFGWLAFSSITYALTDKFGYKKGIVFSAFLNILFALNHYADIASQKTAAILFAAGFLLIFNSIRRKRYRFMCLLGAVEIILGSFYCFKLFPIVLSFAILYLIADLIAKGKYKIKFHKFMDEPFVGLDPKASHLLKEMMREVCDNGGAIFFSTHVLEVAEKLCDKVAIIKGGKLIRSGTIEEVKGDDSLEEVFLELEGE